MAVQLADYIWRDYETDGVSASGFHKPIQREIRALITYLQNGVTGAAAGATIYDSKADMDADTSQAANAMAWVMGDTTVANNGVYQFDGTDTWTRLGDLPYSYIKASNAGAGTANAIIATTSIPIPATDGAALIALPISADNTGAATVAFNGGSALTIKTNNGNDVAVGYLVEGAIVAGFVQGSNFRLISDVGTAADKAAAEAAQASAETAQAAAETAQAAAEAAAAEIDPNTLPHLAEANTFTKTNVFTLTADTAGDRVEISKHSSPANYATTRASFVLQHEENYGGNDVPNGSMLPGVVFVFTDTAQGVTDSSSSSGVITGHGLKSFYHKEGDGSGQAFTVTFELDENGVDKSATGANGYNEGGAFQALMTNIGSSNGYMSGGEVHLRDSPDAGINSYATRMTGFASAIAKYNASTLPSYNFHAINEAISGGEDLDAILYASKGGTKSWKRGIDFYTSGGAMFSTLLAMRMSMGDKISWTNGATSRNIYVSTAGEFVFEGGGHILNVNGTLSNPAYSFSADADTGLFRNAADDVQLVAGGVAGVRVLSNNLQIAIAGGDLQTVTAGAADSAGTGFRQLRIPNAT